MSLPMPRTKEDLSTVLGQIGPGESVAVEVETLFDLFPAGLDSESGDQPARLPADRFAVQHNCDFVLDRAGGIGLFTKAGLPPVGRPE